MKKILNWKLKEGEDWLVLLTTHFADPTTLIWLGQIGGEFGQGVENAQQKLQELMARMVGVGIFLERNKLVETNFKMDIPKPKERTYFG